MPHQPQPISRVMVLAAFVGLPLVFFGYVIVLFGTAHRPLAPALVLSAEATMLTPTPPGPDAMSIANRDHGSPQDAFAAQRATPPLVVDRRHDRRADLMNMASSLRWHHGAASSLPPGSNITGTSAG
jgi:hypothetical protein